MHKAMRIAIVATVKGLAANLTFEWFIAGVYAQMFFIMFRIHKRRSALFAFVRTFARMRCLLMIVQQTASLKAFVTLFAFVSLIIQMGSPFVGH